MKAVGILGSFFLLLIFFPTKSALKFPENCPGNIGLFTSRNFTLSCMETLTFSTDINAPAKTVWYTMLADDTYRQWTKEFHEGSYYEGNWDEGSEIRFVAQDADGNTQGMFSRIKANDRYKFISIEHLGGIKNGEIDTNSEEIKKWAPALDNYTFVDKGEVTELIVEMQTSEEYKPAFNEMWPRALATLKKLCERS